MGVINKCVKHAGDRSYKTITNKIESKFKAFTNRSSIST
jgi:hypothetical protein